MVSPDTTPPSVSANPNTGSFPAARSVTLTMSEPGQIYYALLDGDVADSDVLDLADADALSSDPRVTAYTGPITVSATSTLTFLAFDEHNNVSDQVTERYTITNEAPPAAPTGAAATLDTTANTATLTWTPPDSSGSPVTGFVVRIFNGTTVVSGPTNTTTNSLVVPLAGLPSGVPLTFTVQAQSAAGLSSESAPSAAFTVPVQTVANAGPDRSGVARGTTVSLSAAGSTTAPGTTYQWRQLSGQLVSLSGATTTGPSFSLPAYGPNPGTNVFARGPLVFELAVTYNAATVTDTVAITPVNDTVTITSAKWKTNDFRVVGSSSATSGTVGVYRGSCTATSCTLTPITGMTTQPLSAAAPPATGSTFDIRLRAGVPNPMPATIFVVSANGGIAGPFPVTAG
jgi:hypothetical protein